MSNANIVIVLELDRAADRPRGVATAGGVPRDFHGWLGLAEAIDALASANDDELPSGDSARTSTNEGEQP